jgi:two-component sensor histidine kinase
VITGTAYATYYPFVMFASILIGWRGAVMVTLASALLGNYLFMEPRHVLFANQGDTAGTAAFVLSCALMISLSDTLRRTLRDLEVSRDREAALNAEHEHLNAELQHRVKNTLAVVQGLATQTFRGDPGRDEIVRTFRGRLHALGEAQTILTSGRWESCRLPDLAHRALAPFNGQSAISIDGPPCCLPEAACVPLVLALHELGTNAVKYGALSTVTGSVEVRWALRPAAHASGDAGAAHDLVLDWLESGGPPVSPPSRRGLGSRLIAPQRGIDAAALDFRPEGVACRIVAAGAALLEA